MNFNAMSSAAFHFTFNCSWNLPGGNFEARKLPRSDWEQNWISLRWCMWLTHRRTFRESLKSKHFGVLLAVTHTQIIDATVLNGEIKILKVNIGREKRRREVRGGNRMFKFRHEKFLCVQRWAGTFHSQSSTQPVDSPSKFSPNASSLPRLPPGTSLAKTSTFPASTAQINFSDSCSSPEKRLH